MTSAQAIQLIPPLFGLAVTVMSYALLTYLFGGSEQPHADGESDEKPQRNQRWPAPGRGA